MALGCARLCFMWTQFKKISCMFASVYERFQRLCIFSWFAIVNIVSRRSAFISLKRVQLKRPRSRVGNQQTKMQQSRSRGIFCRPVKSITFLKRAVYTCAVPFLTLGPCSVCHRTHRVRAVNTVNILATLKKYGFVRQE